MNKKFYLFIGFLFTMFATFSQGIKISTSVGTPDPSAILDISAADKGILIPHISLSSETDNTTISNPADGLLIYNTSTTAPLRKGFYFWSSDDNKWHFLYSGHVPSIPGNVEFWIRPDGAKYIRPEYNANARVYDAGQNWSFYYEGSNKHGAFFAGDDVGVIGQRAGTDTSVVPQFINDDFPFSDINTDRTITSDDIVTYSGLYAMGNYYVGVTGIARWDAGVRGIGLGGSSYGEDGTNGTWPVVGVMGEVLDIGNPSDGGYGQQGVYGWHAATPGDAQFCLGVLGTTAQTGAYSAGVGGFNVTDTTTPVSAFAYWNTAGFLGYGATAVYGTVVDQDAYWAGYFSGDVKITRDLYVDGDVYASNYNYNKSSQFLYFSKATQNIIETFGSGKLINGVAKIMIDNSFLNSIKDYKVFIQFTEPISNNYYVEKHKDFFVVREINGKSNASFDWRVVGIRKDTDPQKHLYNKHKVEPIKPITLIKKDFRKVEK